MIEITCPFCEETHPVAMAELAASPCLLRCEECCVEVEVADADHTPAMARAA